MRSQAVFPAALITSLTGALLASGACTPTTAEGPGPEAAGQPAEAPSPAARVKPLGGNNLLKNSSFEDGTSLPWTTSFSAPADGKAAVEGASFCLTIKDRGTNAWDAQVRHREMVLRKGHTYTVKFRAWASRATKVRPKVGMAGPPYAEYWSSTIDLKETPQTFAGAFVMGASDDPTAEMAFHMGGNLASAGPGLRVCLDDIHLDDPDFTPPPKPPAIKHPSVRVNQVGYFPSLAKKAVVKNASTSPVAWELVGEGGGVVASGQTAVFGEEPLAGEHVHTVDFSSYNKPGERFLLKVAGEGGYPFDIKKDIYAKLKYDALAYFYHNRSGIAVTMPFAGRDDLARPAGHLSDKSVPCQPGSGCSYSLDVSGGWYDAGDHGKYVVNGGISVWTMLSQHERTKHLGTSSADFADGKLAIPENKNGVPDLLDEARWQMEFMLRMQVPAGNPKAGMVHHKVHDEKWTALGMAPHEDKMKRYLHAPSTAATLNVAATAAQAARIWKTVDPAFSAKCLAAAESAWTAAQANPSVIAPDSDNSGGGPYGDSNFTDEFYWAAAELFITTGAEAYKAYLLGSPHKAKIPGGGANGSAMAWETTAALGTISLAVVPNGLDKPTLAAMRAAITGAADGYLGAVDGQGYRVPFKPATSGKYPWGSTSFVMNNMIVLALAHDFTGAVKYLNGAVEGMDYLLGKNPMVQSYVTGYGENPLKNPHHRFWSHQANDKFPEAPPGAVSGGPNSGLEDPQVQAAGLAGCAPQKCFVDHIEAWSANEITINWNAPLAWVTAYLDEKGK